MVIFNNFKYFALLFSALLHIMLFCGGFFNQSTSNFNYAIKSQISTGLNFKIFSQNNVVKKQITPTQTSIHKTNSASKKAQNYNFSNNQNNQAKLNNSNITAPQFDAEYLNNIPPKYPASAKRMGMEGEVILLVVVQENGSPAEIKIHQSSGFDILDESAILAVKKWSFISAKQNGQNISASVLVPIKFQLT
jgi:TonB family protein